MWKPEPPSHILHMFSGHSLLTHAHFAVQVELKEGYGDKPSGLYSLEPADAASSSKDASMMLQRQATSSKLANLKISAPPGECIVALLDRQQAMLINDGLITIGSSASIGRGDQERMLRILPGACPSGMSMLLSSHMFKSIECPDTHPLCPRTSPFVMQLFVLKHEIRTGSRIISLLQHALLKILDQKVNRAIKADACQNHSIAHSAKLCV